MGNTNLQQQSEKNTENITNYSDEQIIAYLSKQIKKLQVEAKYFELINRIEKAKYESLIYKIKYFEIVNQGNQNNQDDQKNQDNQQPPDTNPEK